MSRRPHRTARTLGVAALAAGFALVASAVPAVAAPATSVSGQVTGDGRPLAGVVVQIVDIEGITPPHLDVLASTRTAANGTYRLTGFDPGTHRIQFVADRAVGGTSPTGYANACYGSGGNCLDTGTDLTFTSRARSGLNASLPPAGILQGRLVDSLGRGIGGLDVRLLNRGNDLEGDSFDPVYAVVTSDVNGNWVFPRLYAHSWLLCLGLPDYYSPPTGTPNADGYVGTCTANRVTTVAGRTVTLNRTLTGGGGVVGRVVDTAGAPVVGVNVFAQFGQLSSAETTSGAGGAYRLGHVAPGRREVCTYAPGYTRSCVTVTVDQFATTATAPLVLARAA